MGKLLIAGVGGNLGSVAAKVILTLEDKSNLIFCATSEATLKPYADMGIETHVVDFNYSDNLEKAFANAEAVGIISMPFVGEKRQAAHRNAVDAAKKANVKKIVYTSLANAGDETNPSMEKLDHIYTENYIKDSGLDYIFLRNSQFAEAMVTNYFTYVNMKMPLANNMGNGHMAFVSRKDCAKALAYALHKHKEYSHATLDINGKELLTIGEFVNIGNKETGNNVTYVEISDEENYKVFDSMGIPRTTDGKFQDGSEAPFCSDGMVSFGKAIRLEKFAVFTDDFKKLTGEDPISVSYMFANSKDFQVGDRHSKDKK
ncbi:NAD(P)-binding protein [Anaeromyces robustus]|jgi:NAD(P)H dehydrogenase (quinone)|uniref:NAD(P)-binding protein n=1 Tax=Anaeromyces robustus TaxID=1754192 RepID=A0A1Y1XJG8_9FUNG|nr:NAD(P)-binding protein [Anaeromyces robustus]|eukprot:ORX85853.1 NAD(P)-binding protein [Anaeromyces robustus]